MKSNEYYIVRVQQGPCHKDFVITNYDTSELAEQEAMRRARAEGNICPAVQAVTHCALTTLAPIHS